MRVLGAVAATVALVMLVIAAATLLVLPEAPGVASVDMEVSDHIVHAEPLGASVDLRAETVLGSEDAAREARNTNSLLSRRADNIDKARRPTDTLRYQERTGRFSAGV